MSVVAEAREVDLIVLGAGIAGLSCALAAVEQGKKVVVLERAAAPGEGTSRASLRIIHGGFRYLQKLHLSRVWLSLKAKAEFERRFGDLVQPLTSVMPLSGRGLEKSLPVKLACLLYKFLAWCAGASPVVATVLNANESAKTCPLLSPNSYRALSWGDSYVPDHRALVQRMVQLIEAQGGKVLCSTGACEPSLDKGRVRVDTITGDGSRFMGRAVIDARGIYATPVRGFNVILKRQVTAECGIGFRELPRQDGKACRLFFLVPRGSVSVLGTEYLAEATEEPTTAQVESFVLAAAAAFPQLQLRVEDISEVESGVLPGSEPGSVSLQEMSSFELFDGNIPGVRLITTKYTTALVMGREAVAACGRWLLV